MALQDSSSGCGGSKAQKVRPEICCFLNIWPLTMKMITALHFVDKLCNEQQILGLKKDIFNVLAISAAAKAGDVETTRQLLAERSAAQV